MSVSITVLLTCYNEVRYIREALESVLAQSFLHTVAEIIVIDDGSDDGSHEILKEFDEKYDLVTVIYQKNTGLPGARNSGLRRAIGSHVALLDGDDVWNPDYLKLQVANLVDENTVVSYTGWCEFGTSLPHDKSFSPRAIVGVGKDAVRSYYIGRGPILPSAAVFRRDVALDVGLFDESFKSVEDTEFFMRLLEYGVPKCEPLPAVKRRIHENSMTEDIFTKYRYQMKLITKMRKTKKYLWDLHTYRWALVKLKLINKCRRDRRYRDLLLALVVR